MSLLSYNDLVKLVEQGIIDAPIENINGASIDITLDDLLLLEMWYRPEFMPVISLAHGDRIATIPYVLTEENPKYQMACGEFLLASSIEKFNLPTNISAMYRLKSTLGRNGLDHMNSEWCDAGWNDSKLTLELKNHTRYNMLEIERGMKIGQMIFFKHKKVPKRHSYANNGQYNGQKETTPGGVLR